MATATPRPPSPSNAERKFPYFVGFYVSKDQREKLDAIARETHRNLAQMMRLVVDNLKCTVVELDLTTSEVTRKDTPAG